jgi:hypothetical protein
MIINQITSIYPQDLSGWERLYEGERPTIADQLVAQAIAEFKVFSAQLQAYIEDVIEKKAYDSALTTPDRLRARFYQVFNDYWAPLGQVAAQRQISLYRDRLNQGTEQANAFLGQLGLKIPGSLIYFNKVASVEYYPFTDIPFIGTPYTQIVFDDWMAIPHELAHYLYWKLEGSLGQTRDWHRQLKEGAIALFRQQPVVQVLTSDEQAAVLKMLTSWIEEAFCDVVGTRLGGQAYVESLKTLIANSVDHAGELVEDDGQHPPYLFRAWLREYVYQVNGGIALGLEEFIKNLLHIEDVDGLEKALLSANFDQLAQNLSPSLLIEAIKSPEVFLRKDFPAIRLTAGEFRSVITSLAEFLNQQFDQSVSPKTRAARSSPEPAGSFARLLSLAEVESASKGMPVYEVLLQPRVLEGGNQHGPHGCWGHASYHTIGVHNA